MNCELLLEDITTTKHVKGMWGASEQAGTPSWHTVVRTFKGQYDLLYSHKVIFKALVVHTISLKRRAR